MRVVRVRRFFAKIEITCNRLRTFLVFVRNMLHGNAMDYAAKTCLACNALQGGASCSPRDGCGVGGTIEGVGNKRVAGTTGSRASANGDDWGEGESVGTCV